jgi:hypothetical protein
MLLSVITPDKQPGMNGMLKKELEGIDAEVISKPWAEGILEAKGDFICLLEENSAIRMSTIRDNLHVFTDKPAYRKLAMVSCMVDLPEAKVNVAWTYNNGLQATTYIGSDSTHAARIGYVPGAIVRTSSLRKANLSPSYPPTAFSCGLSLFFWENGLRVALNPETLYYAPENASYTWPAAPNKSMLIPTAKVMQLWEHEMIS